MSFFNMTTGTYTDYNDMLNKIKDVAVSLGFTVVNHGDNILYSGSNQVLRGTRLNLQKGNTFLNLAGASGINPSSYFLQSLTNNSKVIQCSISNTYSSSFWSVDSNRIKTSQVGENNTYYIFTKGDGFLVCMKISARQYTFINFLNIDSYNSANTLKCCSAGRSSGQSLSSSDYNTTIQAYVHYPFLCHRSLYRSSGSDSQFDVMKNEQDTFTSARFNFLTNAYSGSQNVYSNQFSYGYNNISSPLGKSKSPFSAKSSPFLIDIRNYFSNTSIPTKLGAIKDMYVVVLDGYESGEIFDIGSGSTTETYICLPFFEKPPASEATDIYGYNLGVIIKIGEVNA